MIGCGRWFGSRFFIVFLPINAFHVDETCRPPCQEAASLPTGPGSTPLSSALESCLLSAGHLYKIVEF